MRLVSTRYIVAPPFKDLVLQIDRGVLTLQVGERSFPSKIHFAFGMGNAASNQEFEKVLHLTPQIRG
jgi:hypothetical protein